MGNRVKLLKIGMWALVVFSILLFVVIIIIGHSYSFNFFSQGTAEDQAVVYSSLKEMNVI